MKFFTNWIESIVRNSVRECLFDSADARELLCGTVAAEVSKAISGIDTDEIADRLAEKVDVDTGEIARSVARNIDMDDVVSRVADEIDMGQVCEQCAEKIKVDTDDVVERAAELAKDDIDVDSVIEKVAENIDWEADVLDYEQLAKALLKCFAKTIVKS